MFRIWIEEKSGERGREGCWLVDRVIDRYRYRERNLTFEKEKDLRNISERVYVFYEE
jgi:hypothetical protein